ncbi:MAG: hypothetical protein LBO02_01155 [Holosporaceae bacterium]|jgi:NADH-quinone oxidoreductase subunit L|nr:hypothetical protein [Holosporaceae bacterium]
MIAYVIVFQLIVLSISLIYRKNYEKDRLKYVVVSFSALTALVATFATISQLCAPAMEHLHFYNFVSLKNTSCKLGILSDSLSIISAWVVCVITAIANCYSIGYVKKNLDVFLCRINSLSLAATLFASSGNLLQMYICGEAMAVASCFLVSFDNKDLSFAAALKMAFANKLGDVGLVISMTALFQVFGSLNLDEINKFFVGNDVYLRKLETIATIMSASIFIKSAQIGSTDWVKNSMRAPMPALALIHSSTLLTAGVFWMIRLPNLFECSESIQNIIIAVGLFCSVIYSIKAIFAADVEGIFAYSTSSQVGLMLSACGFSAYGAALILFVSHAFSKSLLLFSMGSVVYALSGERDIKNMGGLFELLPKTYVAFVLALASMINIPLLPSYYARKILLNEIIGGDLVNPIALIMIIMASILTVAYLFRVTYLIFHGEIRAAETSLAYLNENDNFIINSLYISIFFAIFSGVFFYYAVYNDVVWADLFAFSYAENGYAIFAFSIINFIGVVAAFLICKSIKSRNLSLKLTWKISDSFKKTAFRLVENIDEKLYRKCYLLIARAGERESTNAGQ